MYSDSPAFSPSLETMFLHVAAAQRRLSSHHEVGDVAAILAAGPLDKSRDRKQAHLDRINRGLQNGPDSA